jgi:MOSC domain-containing protein YiiM
MSVEQIVIAPAFGAPLEARDAIDVVAGQGIVGDRHFGLPPDDPGLQFTLIEAEAVERFNAEHGLAVRAADARRNVVTRSVRLAPLIGRRFTIGTVLLRGVEVCEPCASLGRRFAGGSLRPADVVRWFAAHGGLRADVLTSGRIELGDPIRLAD